MLMYSIYIVLPALSMTIMIITIMIIIIIIKIIYVIISLWNHQHVCHNHCHYHYKHIICINFQANNSKSLGQFTLTAKGIKCYLYHLPFKYHVTFPVVEGNRLRWEVGSDDKYSAVCCILCCCLLNVVFAVSWTL